MKRKKALTVIIIALISSIVYFISSIYETKSFNISMQKPYSLCNDPSGRCEALAELATKYSNPQ